MENKQFRGVILLCNKLPHVPAGYAYLDPQAFKNTYDKDGDWLNLFSADAFCCAEEGKPVLIPTDDWKVVSYFEDCEYRRDDVVVGVVSFVDDEYAQALKQTMLPFYNLSHIKKSADKQAELPVIIAAFKQAKQNRLDLYALDKVD